MKIAIIKYNAGNVRSVSLALSRIGYESIITDREDEILNADRVIFPGQGEASSALRYLRERNLESVIKGLTAPMLGICLGHQLYCDRLEEGESEGLGIISAKAVKFKIERKIPHIGWAKVSHNTDGLFKGIQNNSYFYFVHSYFVPSGIYETASSNYGEQFCSALKVNNYLGVQFHPEKSGHNGEILLRNFIERAV